MREVGQRRGELVARAPRPRRARPRSRLTSAASSRISRDHAPRRRSPARFAAAISSEAAFCARAAAPRPRAAARGGGRRARAARRGPRPRRGAPAPPGPGPGPRGSRCRSSTGCRALLPGGGRCSSDWISLASPGCGGRSTSVPAYSATNSATASASSPTTMFWGMIAPEKPPLRIAKRTSSALSSRWSRFGPWLRSARFAEPCGAGGLQRVAAGAALGEQHGARRSSGSSSATWMPSLPQAPRASATASCRSGEGENGVARAAASYFPTCRCVTAADARPAPRARWRSLPTAVTVVTAAGAGGPGRGDRQRGRLALARPAADARLPRPRLAHARAVRAAPAASAINVLGAGRRSSPAPSRTKAPHTEKWRGRAWTERDGVPILDGAIVWVACELRDVHDGGDHVIVTGRWSLGAGARRRRRRWSSTRGAYRRPLTR